MKKKIILDYILSKLIKLRELKADHTTITHLEEDFDKLRKEKQSTEENLAKVKALKRNIQN